MLPLRFRLGIHDGDDGVDQIGEIELLVVDGEFPAFYLGHVQNVVEQRHEVLGGKADLMEAVGHPPVVLDMGGGDGRHPDDGVHGGADFVAHAGKEVAFGCVGLLCALQRFLERLPRLHLAGAIRQGHDVPDGARVFLYRVQVKVHEAVFAGQGILHRKVASLRRIERSQLSEIVKHFLIRCRKPGMQDADIVVSKAEYAVGVSADILYAPVPYMVNDEDVVYVVAQEIEQFFPVRDGLFGLFLKPVEKERHGQDNEDEEKGTGRRHVDGKGRLPYEFTYLTVGKRDNRFERILKLDIGGFHIGINIGKDLRFRV